MLSRIGQWRDRLRRSCRGQYVESTGSQFSGSIPVGYFRLPASGPFCSAARAGILKNWCQRLWKRLVLPLRKGLCHAFEGMAFKPFFQSSCASFRVFIKAMPKYPILSRSWNLSIPPTGCHAQGTWGIGLASGTRTLKELPGPCSSSLVEKQVIDHLQAGQDSSEAETWVDGSRIPLHHAGG